LSAFFALALSSGALQPSAAESADEKAIHETLDRFIGSYFDGDFARLGSLLHATTRRLFRDELSAKWDQLQLVYTFEQISAVSGLAAYPKDLALSDAEFFIVACQQTKARHPEIVPDQSLLPFDIRSSAFHGNNVDVTLSYGTRVITERTNYAFALPVVVIFQRESAGWQVLSCPFSRAIADRWQRDLACQNKRQP
jgi:hypothetical protein